MPCGDVRHFCVTFKHIKSSGVEAHKCNPAATSSVEGKVYNLYTFDNGLAEAESDFEVRYVSVRHSEALELAVILFEEPDKDVIAVPSQNRRGFIEADVASEGFEVWNPDIAKDSEGVGWVNGEVLEVR